jgi:hypothetical protein
VDTYEVELADAVFQGFASGRMTREALDMAILSEGEDARRLQDDDDKNQASPPEEPDEKSIDNEARAAN